MLAASSRFDRLLVPVDLSPASKRVLEYALDFGALFGSTLDVLYVWQTSTERLVTSAREEGERALAGFVADLGAILTARVGAGGSGRASSRALLHTCRVPSLLVPTNRRRGLGPSIRRERSSK
jgi:hypothetical protein